MAETSRDARFAVAGIVAPFVFISGWVLCGIARQNYSPRTDYISELAEVSSPTRWAMSAAFVGFGVLMLVFSRAVRAHVSRPASIAARWVGIGTILVALLPIGSSLESLHGVAAVIAYASLVAFVATCAWALRRRTNRMVFPAAVVTIALMVLSLASTSSGEAVGLNQRIGLTLGDIWIVGVAVWVLRQTRKVTDLDDES